MAGLTIGSISAEAAAEVPSSGGIRVRAGEPTFKRLNLSGLSLFRFVLMSYWVYIIRSQSTGRHYCGYSDDVDRRLGQHNDPEYRLTRTTKVFKGPWELIWKQQCSNRSEAVTLERQIKKRGIGRYLKTVELAESRQGRD